MAMEGALFPLDLVVERSLPPGVVVVAKDQQVKEDFLKESCCGTLSAGEESPTMPAVRSSREVPVVTASTCCPSPDAATASTASVTSCSMSASDGGSNDGGSSSPTPPSSSPPAPALPPPTPPPLPPTPPDTPRRSIFGNYWSRKSPRAAALGGGRPGIGAGSSSCLSSAQARMRNVPPAPPLDGCIPAPPIYFSGGVTSPPPAIIAGGCPSSSPVGHFPSPPLGSPDNRIVSPGAAATRTPPSPSPAAASQVGVSPTQPGTVMDNIRDPSPLDPLYRLQSERHRMWPSYCGKYHFSPTPSPHMLSLSPAGPGAGMGDVLHKPPTLSLIPKPSSILRRRASDHASDHPRTARSSFSSSPTTSPRSRLPPTEGASSSPPSSSSVLTHLQLRRAQSDSLRAIEDVRSCVYGDICRGEGCECGFAAVMPPPPLFDQDGQQDCGANDQDLAECAAGEGVFTGFSPRPNKSLGAGGPSSPGASLGGIPPPPLFVADDGSASSSGSDVASCSSGSSDLSPPPVPRGRTSSSGSAASVRFDPRVSVMEYFSDDERVGGGGPPASCGKAAGASIRNCSRGVGPPRGGDEEELRAAAAAARGDERSRWFTPQELDEFKREAIVLAQKFYLISCAYSAERARAEEERAHGCGGGQSHRRGSEQERERREALKRHMQQQAMLQQQQQQRRRKALFANPALRATEEDRIVFENSREMGLLLASQIRNVMIVDPHDVFLDMFYQYVKRMIPHAGVITVKSGEEALRRIMNAEKRGAAGGNKNRGGGKGEGDRHRNGGRTHLAPTDANANPKNARCAEADEGFDIIIVEERLHECRMSRESSWAGDPSSGESSASPSPSPSPSSSFRDDGGEGELPPPWSPNGPESRRQRVHSWTQGDLAPAPWQSAGEEERYRRIRHRPAAVRGGGGSRRGGRRERVPLSGSQLLCHIRFMQEQQRCPLPLLREQCADAAYGGSGSSSPAFPRRGPGSMADSSSCPRPSLLIGVSGWLGEDCEKLQRGGADMLWGKPPPVMDNRLRNELLMALLAKRGHPIFICD